MQAEQIGGAGVTVPAQQLGTRADEEAVPLLAKQGWRIDRLRTRRRLVGAGRAEKGTDMGKRQLIILHDNSYRP